MSAGGGLGVPGRRPAAGTPRPYHFPVFRRRRLACGAALLTAPVPGRPLVSARLILEGGAAAERAEVGGVSVLAAQALTEGTERYSAIELIEATERLGADLHAEAGWDGLSIGLAVPVARLEPALALLAEVALRPVFPESEVARLRDERLADLMQARAEPRRLAELHFLAAIYREGSPYARPVGGLEPTVGRLDRAAVAARFAAAADPARATLVVAGEVEEEAVAETLERLFGDWHTAAPVGAVPVDDRDSVERTFVRLVDRPGSVQSELRIGHVGVPRRIADFHATAVTGAILGGLFRSRLQLKLREEKGYTYGASASFDFRRAAGPFTVRTAVRTDATAPAIADTLAELERIRDEPVQAEELAAARDFLVGVFPLRFETPGAIAAAIGGLVVHGLPDDELERYRPAVSAVTAEQVQQVARARIHPDRVAILVVGDADAVDADLRAAGFGDVQVVREAQPATGT